MAVFIIQCKLLIIRSKNRLKVVERETSEKAVKAIDCGSIRGRSRRTYPPNYRGADIFVLSFGAGCGDASNFSPDYFNDLSVAA